MLNPYAGLLSSASEISSVFVRMGGKSAVLRFQNCFKVPGSNGMLCLVPLLLGLVRKCRGVQWNMIDILKLRIRISPENWTRWTVNFPTFVSINILQPYIVKPDAYTGRFTFSHMITSRRRSRPLSLRRAELKWGAVNHSPGGIPPATSSH